MPSRGSFLGLSGRRLHVSILSFFLVATLLWSHLRTSTSSDTSLDSSTYAGDLKNGLEAWEPPIRAPAPIPDAPSRPATPTVDAACQPLRPRETPGHVTAYLIMVHSEATLEGARLLLEQIHDPHDYFLIHADKKLVSPQYERYKSTFTRCSNVEFVPDHERIPVGWGDITMIDAEIVMLKQALKSSIVWTKMMLLDGTSWPVLDADRRQEWYTIFENEIANGGVGSAPAPICEYGQEVKLFDGDCWRTNARCLNEDCSRMSETPYEAPVRKGNQWTVMTRGMVDYAIYGKDAQAWYDFFRNTTVPDEHFFATIRYAQPGAPTGWLRVPMYVHWGPCRSHPVEKFQGHPCSLGMKDLESITSSVSMFARKVTLDESELRLALSRGEPKAVHLTLESGS
ncbi:uncharacterized protein JCM15063_000318 [Sporobolomyces koalae]|uniref:uncharacterized protein n=1 Tax=Sporobolomyces koalae TaxID=500713 RepID=UPI00316CEAAD